MAVTYFPFNSIVVGGVPDRPANAENLAAYLAGFFGNGVLMQKDTALKVEVSSGMNVQIAAGTGNINGKTILNDAAEVIALEAASASLDRIDRIVFRLDEPNRIMEFAVLKGIAAASPTAPALTRNADVYELCLAEIRVPAGATSIVASYITDTRTDADLCGSSGIAPHMQDIEHGGTGADNKEEALENLGGMSMTLLWPNEKPDSAFPAQTIPLDLSEYDFIEIMSDLNGYGVFMMSKHPVGKLSAITSGNEASGATNLNYLRRIECTTSGITFNDAYFNNTLNNNYLIPHRIYGIKGVQ